MKKIMLISITILFCSSTSYADYSKNPNCRGYGLFQQAERNNCLEANRGLSSSSSTAATTNSKKPKKKFLRDDGKIDTSGIRNSTGKLFNKLGVNTDSKLLKTGKYSENK